MIRLGYIVNPKADFVWYLGLPLFALAFALACQHWLTAVAITSVALLFNAPHNFVTLLRTFGLEEDRHRFRDQLIVGLVLISVFTVVGMKWAPMTILLLSVVWNHQHNLMQLHGFARIYDHKAQAGTPSTPHWDLTLNWVLYVNMLLTAQLFANFWIRELYRFELQISADSVRMLQTASWCVTAGFMCLYSTHVFLGVRNGHAVNPLKFAFLFANYAVLYIASWNTTSILVHSIANGIMHGLQYMVIVYLYMQRKVEQVHQDRGWINYIVRPGNVMAYVAVCLLYTVIVQLIAQRPFEEFGFGAISFTSRYDAIPDHQLAGVSLVGGYEMFALLVMNVPGLLHLYYDSFIWKVRDAKIQQGL
ncbi:MAG: hypothetical protein H6821_14815 [Planctomycetaceae bacterium]|nr:hypothetical protein [Planctomycetales bacterium]MCB9875442.1 hypothetical protein [Planctomycetaceae bacterium]MCB9938044.1 hypothetical protein [Planctomycetaceae bacterium]HRX79776.1 hypothetical protein [Pirellulaceae bacterium]